MKDVKHYHDKLNDSLMNFHLNPEIEILEAENNPPISKKNIEKVGCKHSSELYSYFDGCAFKWINSGKKISGSLSIQSLEDSLAENWQDMATAVIDGSQKLKDFRVFDLYSNQNYVGFFMGDYSESGLYYVRELDAYKLNLSKESYFKLAVETMGLMHWPSLIINWEYNLPLNESLTIQKQLEDEIPSFDMGSFKQLYADLRM